jgi:hypothetical protein
MTLSLWISLTISLLSIGVAIASIVLGWKTLKIHAEIKELQDSFSKKAFSQPWSSP